MKIKEKTLKTIAIGVAFSFILLSVFMLWISTFEIPDLDSFDDRVVPESTKIFDRTGEILLYDIHQNIKRELVKSEDIAVFAKNASVAIEDVDFYNHQGIKPTAIIRAVFANILSKDFGQGGSTITQQVVKNSILTTEKKVTRKIKEWVLAIKLEKQFTKDEILTMYLNEAPYGGSIYGIEEASKTFFGIDAKDLSLAQSAYMAAIPNAPTYYSPYGTHRKELEERKNLVLKRMLDNRFITQNEYQKALDDVVLFKERSDEGILSPHFTLYVREYLENKYGKDLVESGGLNVITTLDYNLQKNGEDIVNRYALDNSEKFNAENAGLIAIDNETGQILTMVGSRDYFDKEIDGNFNVTLAKRQPGSTFKPFVYATALKKGFTTETVVWNLQTEFSTYCRPDGELINDNGLNEEQKQELKNTLCYSPENYDGEYTGPMTFRNALAQSVNIPAIKALYLAGLPESLQTAKDLGITTLTNSNRYGLTLVLGGGEATLLEMTSAYSVFANEGIKNQTTPILKITDKSGNILEEYTPKQNRVLDEKIARDITDILSDNEARTPAFGNRSYLYFEGIDVAAKTGTTNDYRDAWIIGYSSSVSVGAWAGNNDNSPMEKKVAGFIIAPLWNNFMQEIIKTYPSNDFIKDNTDLSDLKPVLRGVWQGGTTYKIDTLSGKLATQYTPKETTKEVVITNPHSILYWVDKNNPQGTQPTNPENDPQFERWEYRIEEWAQKNGYEINRSPIIPTDFDNIHTPSNSPKISISSPKNDSTHNLNNKINIGVQNLGSKYPLSKYEFYINDKFIGSSKSPYFSFIPNDVDGIKNSNVLKVVAFDSVLNQTERQVSFNIIN